MGVDGVTPQSGTYRTEVVVEPYETTVEVELVAVETTYYYLSAAQTAPEHREVTTPG